MVFSSLEIEEFVERGFLILRAGFDVEVANKCRKFIWNELGLPENDPTAWKDSIIHLKTGYVVDPFKQILNARLRNALDQLMGQNRGFVHRYFGWWPVLFPGFNGSTDWHVDGRNFHHHLNSKEQGLVTLYMFSDIELGGGGTALAVGSHKLVARVLAAAEPVGLSFEDLLEALPKPQPSDIVEITGNVGDVAILHPFLIHGFSPNTSQRVRFACNPQYPLREPMQLSRPDENYSPVEQAIRKALE